MIEQVGDDHKKGLFPASRAIIRNGSREVRLAAAVGAHQHQPAARALGKLLGGAEALLQAALHIGGQAVWFAHAKIAKSAVIQQVEG